MTFRGFVLKYCTDRGMSDDEARQVLDAVMKSPLGFSAKDIWDCDASNYPESISVVLSLATDKEALNYLDRTCPEAWYRDLFAS